MQYSHLQSTYMYSIWCDQEISSIQYSHLNDELISQGVKNAPFICHSKQLEVFLYAHCLCTGLLTSLFGEIILKAIDCFQNLIIKNNK